MIVEFIKYSLLITVFLTVILLPFYIAKNKELRSYQTSFLGGVFLLFVAIALYSIWFTGFKTINLLSLPLLLILAVKYRSYNVGVPITAGNSREGVIYLMLSILVATLSVYILQLLFPYAESINSDIIFYSKVAENLSISGNENTFQHFNGTAEAFSGTFPYHYFELWLANMLFKLFPSLSSVVVLKYITYPLLKSLAIWGVWAVFCKNPKKQI